MNVRDPLLLFPLLWLSCQPIHDLDAARSGDKGGAASGSIGNAGPTGSSSTAMTAEPTTVTSSGGSGTGSGGDGGSGGTAVVGGQGANTASASVSNTSDTGTGGAPDVGTSGTATGSMGGGTSGGSSDAGGVAGATTGGGSGGSGGDAPELPIDLPGNPVQGTFTVSSEAEWEVEGVFLPTFEVHTPTASYWLVKDLGMMVSMMDSNMSDQRQWIDFSSGFRPLRGLPSFASFGNETTMNTTLETDSQTPTHLRLHSESESGTWRIVYDFYPTHITLTVNSAPIPYGIAYRGVPGGSLESTDLFVRPDGTSQDALVSSVVDLPGPVEWAYVSDTTLGRSLLLLHHGDDELTDRFQVRDGDSVFFSFGDGELTQLPKRFSFAIIESADHQTVAERATFIMGAID